MNSQRASFGDHPHNPWTSGENTTALTGHVGTQGAAVPVSGPSSKPESGDRRGRILVGAVSAVVALAVGVGAGWGLGSSGSEDAEDSDSDVSVPMYGGPAPDGFRGDPAQVPAAIAPTIFDCRATRDIAYTDGGDLTDGTHCDIVVSGYFGVMVSASGDREWIEDALDASEDQPDYRSIEVPGFDAYTYSWQVSRSETATVISLVDPDREFYLDFVAQGMEDSEVPNNAEDIGFTTAVLDALAVDSASTRAT
ncbi:hypothetical protein [Corynebacterium variabile]|uniref:hypothetical protein n=1 Tax=Corynebacterium variabile TaxID=1727 RepID=UPI003A8F332C